MPGPSSTAPHGAPVTVLLATRNGARHLTEQIDSLLAQTEPVRVLVRDDASTDGTAEILADLCRQHPSITWIEPGSPAAGSAAANFSRLLTHVLEATDPPAYLLFCDQDDVWFPTKVETLLARMRLLQARYPEAPLLIHGDMVVTDDHLHPLHPSLWGYQHSDPRRDGLNRLLLQNTVTGCGSLFNLALARLAAPIPAGAAMHDWWLALVAAAFGRIEALPEPTLYYRQHGANATGAQRFDAAFILGRVLSRPLLERNFLQARAFLERYGDRLTPARRRLVADFAALPETPWLRRRRVVITHRLWKQGWIRNLGLLLNL